MGLRLISATQPILHFGALVIDRHHLLASALTSPLPHAMEQPSDFLRTRLAHLPPVPSFPDDQSTDDNKTDTSTETDSSTASIQTITLAHPKSPSPPSPPSPHTLLMASRTAADPVPWTQYFAHNIHVPSSTTPTLVFNVYYSPPKAANAPVYVFHHGAGSCALSFSLVAGHLVSAISCGVIAFDVRHHGATVIDEAQEWDLSLETLARDEIDVVGGVAEHANWETGHWPDFILVGHRYAPPSPPISPRRSFPLLG
jgi:protein phosphatase methylesterase 1